MKCRVLKWIILSEKEIVKAIYISNLFYHNIAKHPGWWRFWNIHLISCTACISFKLIERYLDLLDMNLTFFLTYLLIFFLTFYLTFFLTDLLIFFPQCNTSKMNPYPHNWRLRHLPCLWRICCQLCLKIKWFMVPFFPHFVHRQPLELQHCIWWKGCTKWWTSVPQACWITLWILTLRQYTFKCKPQTVQTGRLACHT